MPNRAGNNAGHSGSFGSSVTSPRKSPLSGSGVKSISFDTTPPTFGGQLTYSNTSASGTTISWSAASDDTGAAGYLKYRIFISASSPPSLVSGSHSYQTSAGSTSYAITDRSPGTQYHVVVKAVDVIGNESTNTSSSYFTTTSDSTAPTFAGLTSAYATGSSIQLSWNPAQDDFTATNSIIYRIHRATSSGGQAFASILDAVTGSTSYLDSTILAGTRYYYVVRARDAAGNTDSNTTECDAVVTVTWYRMQGYDVDVTPRVPRCWTVTGSADTTGAYYDVSPNTGPKAGGSPLAEINTIRSWTA